MRSPLLLLLLAGLLQAGCAQREEPDPIVFRAALAAIHEQAGEVPLPKGRENWVRATAPRLGLIETWWIPSADGLSERSFAVRVRRTTLEIQAWSRPAAKDSKEPAERRKDLEEALGKEILRLSQGE